MRPATRPAPLQVLCGASLAPPAEALLREVKGQARLDAVVLAGDSDDLLKAVQARNDGDLFISHDPYPGRVQQADALGDRVQVGRIAPVVAVQKGNPLAIFKVEDLARPGLRIALSDPAVSECGEMFVALARKKNIYDRVMANVGDRLIKGHGMLAQLLVQKKVDAAILWNAVAWSYGDDLLIVQTPYEYDREIRIYVMGLSYSTQPDRVRRFLEIARQRGPAIFASFGYGE